MNHKKRVSFNRSITVKEFNLKHQVNDDQHTDLYQAPMDLTGCSIDTTTSEDMDLTELITDVTTVVSQEDTIMKGVINENEDNFSVNEICDVTIDTSLRGSLQDLTVLQDNILGGVQEKETVRARRQSPRLAKRASGENDVPVISKKQKGVKEAIELSKSMTTPKLKPNLTGSTENVSEKVNHSLTTTPTIQKIVVTPRQSSRLKSKKPTAVSEDVIRDKNQSISQSFGVQNQSSCEQNPQYFCHGSSIKPVNVITNSFKGQSHSSILNSTQNETLPDVTPQLLFNTPSQTNQMNFISNFSESHIELLESSVTSHGIQKVVNKEHNEDDMVKNYLMKNQVLDKEIEKLKLEDEKLDLELSRLEKELRDLPDESTLAIYKSIFDED